MTTSHRQFVFITLALASLIVGLAIFYIHEFDALRNHGGDAVATVFLFSCLTLVLKRTWTITLATLAITFGIEFAQLAPLFEQYNMLTELLLGHHFDTIDLIVYVVTTIAMAGLHTGLGKSS